MTDIQTEFDRRIPLRDGVTLSADVYRPRAAGKYPTIVVCTPYNKAGSGNTESGHFYAGQGFAYVVVDVRERGDSDGVFVPYRNEGIDGYDVIEWAAAQSWSNGNVGTLGGSYVGCVQWLAALHRPPHLKAMTVLVTPSDPFVETPTGIPSPMHLCWLHYVSGRVNQNMQAVNWTEVYNHLPLLTMDEVAGRVNTHWREQISHPQFDAYWDTVSYQQKFDQIDVPVLHVTGWYDDEQVGTPLNYIGMTKHGRSEHTRANQRLLVGPWGHATNATSRLGEVDFGPSAIIDIRADYVTWFKRWLLPESEAIPIPQPNVKIFVMGVNQWREEQEWPLARTLWTPYYLHSGGQANSRYGDGSLTPTVPENEHTDTYQYDPSRPVPFISEPTSSQIGGPDDYAAVEQRADVLVYTTAVLDSDMEVTGPIRVTLFAASSALDTDFTAKLIDVWPSGFAQRLCDGMVRARFRDSMATPTLIEPGRIYEYTIDCWNIAQVFRKGHSIRLEISSSAFPKYDRNLNTGATLGQTAEFIAATQTIYHDAAHPSHITLPIIPG